MEDVLDQYEKPLDPAEPVICLDEQPYQLLDDVRPSQPAGPGQAAKQDYEYRRCGVGSLVVQVSPCLIHFWLFYSVRSQGFLGFIVSAAVLGCLL